MREWGIVKLRHRGKVQDVATRIGFFVPSRWIAANFLSN